MPNQGVWCQLSVKRSWEIVDYNLIVSCGVHRELESLSSLLLTRFDKIWFVNVSVLRLNRGLLNLISHFTVLVCHKTLNTLTSVSRGKPKHRVAPSLSKPKDYHRGNTFLTSLGKILAENKNSLEMIKTLCALGHITLSDSPTSDSFDLTARYYDLDKDLWAWQADQRLFSQFKTTHEEETAKNSCRSNY